MASTAGCRFFSAGSTRRRSGAMAPKKSGCSPKGSPPAAALIAAMARVISSAPSAVVAIGHKQERGEGCEGGPSPGLDVAVATDFEVLRQPVRAVEDVVPDVVAAGALVGEVKLPIVHGERGAGVGLGVPVLGDLEVLRQPVRAVERVEPKIVAAGALVGEEELAVVHGERGAGVGLGMPVLSDLEVLRQPVRAVEHIVPKIVAASALVGEVELAIERGERGAGVGLGVSVLGDLEIGREPGGLAITRIVPEVVAAVPLIREEELAVVERHGGSLAGQRVP